MASKMFKGDTYSKGAYIFPSDEIAPMKKRKGQSAKEFALAFSKAFYAGWGNGSFPSSKFVERDELIQLRNYGRGNQPLDSYYDFWYGRNDQDQIIREGRMNINWEILDIILKYKDRFMSELMKYEYDPVISSQDQYSRNERQEKMMLDYVKNKMKGIFPTQEEENNIAPDTMAEFEILEQMGVYKNKAEYCWEKFINNVFNGFNKWDAKLKTKLLEDIWSMARLCVRDYVDPDTQTIKVQYIDPCNLIIRLTTDGEVIDGGFVDLMTVQDLRKASGLDEATLFSIAQSACGWYGNPGNPDGSGWMYGATYDNWLASAVGRTSPGNCEWYAFRVPVLKCEYRSVDTDYYTEQDLGNEKKYTRAKWGKVYTQSPSRKTIKKSTINYYTCSWIIGTEHCYDYGLQYDMPRTKRAEARCSFHYYQMDDHSIVKRMKPAVDLTLNAWYNFQNNISKSKPSGYLYDISAIRNANVGDKLKAAEIIKGIMQTGSGIFSSTNKRSDRPVIAPQMGPPVIPVPGGYLEAANEFAVAFNQLSALMADLAGMTPSFTGASEGLPEGARVNEGQANASLALLAPKRDAYLFVRESCALNILLRGQVVFRHNKEMTEEYRQILGDQIVKILKISSEKNYAQFGMKMNLRISGELKAKVEAAATAALQAGRNGQPGITFMEYFKILNMLESGVEIKFIEGFLERLIMKREQQMQQNALQSQDNQNKGLMMMEQQKTQGQMEVAKFMTDLEIQKGVILEAAKAHFSKEGAAVQGEINAASSALELIMQTAMQQYLSMMGPQKAA